MIKKGDTLIEVTIAVGIFSMVAIAIVSVMSGGTSSAQTALETTLAREEIDTQAEALRFIQASYIADRDSAEDAAGKNRRFVKLWELITGNAITLSSNTTSASAILQYAPNSCPNLYNNAIPNNIFEQKAFVINPRMLGNFTDKADSLKKVYISTQINSDKFAQSSTFPRLIYSSTESELSSNDNETELYKAEGIYVIAIKDSETTRLVGEIGTNKTSAFYDFYIRTCWYGTNAKRPSLISTVVRLYDPDAI